MSISPPLSPSTGNPPAGPSSRHPPTPPTNPAPISPTDMAPLGQQGPDVADAIKAVDLEGVVVVEDDNTGVAFEPGNFDINEYHRDEILVRLDQLLPPEVPLRDMNDSHSRTLYESMQVQQFDYGSGFMKVTPGSDCTDIVQFKKDSFRVVSNGKRVLKSGLSVETIDGGHRRETMIRGRENKDEKFEWVHDPLRVIMYTRKDEKPLCNMEKIFIARRANANSTKVLGSTSLLDLLKSIRNFAKTFPERHQVEFLVAQTAQIAEQMHQARFLGDLSLASYRRYVRVGKLIVAFPYTLTVLSDLASEGGSQVIGITHLDDKTLFGAGKVFIPLIFRAVDMYLRQKDRAVFNAHAFYTIALRLFKDVYEVFLRLKTAGPAPHLPEEAAKVETFDDFLTVHITLSGTSTQSIWTSATNVIKRFRHDVNDKRGKLMVEHDARAKRFITRVTNKFFPRTAASSRPPKGNVGVDANVPARQLRKRKAMEVIDMSDDRSPPPPKRQRKRPSHFTPNRDDSKTNPPKKSKQAPATPSKKKKQAPARSRTRRSVSTKKTTPASARETPAGTPESEAARCR